MTYYSLSPRLFSLTLAVAAVFGAWGGSTARAFAPEEDLMKVKGYSPEVIRVTDVQRSRQEWRTPVEPTQTPVERFFHNIYYGEWTEGIDTFGEQIIRDH
jgi:hypothetical protein